MYTDQLKNDIKEIINNEHLFNCLKSKKVLITGATGFIGSMLIRTLIEVNKEWNMDIDIIGLVRNINKFNEIIPEASQFCTIISNYSEINAVDYIIHTISPTASKYFISNPVETIQTNYQNTFEILELAKKNDATIVYLSSMEQYGVPYTEGDVMSEDKIGIIDHLDVRSSYSESKRLCECMCVSYHNEYGVNVMIARLAQTFGAGAPLSDNRMPMQFARAVRDKENIVLYTEGKSFSNVVYITDAITGLFTVLLKGKAGEAYNICNDLETKSVKSIADLVSVEVSEGEIEVETRINNSMGFAPTVCMFLNSDKLRNLGWKPQVGIVDGYKRLVEYLKECD